MDDDIPGLLSLSEELLLAILHRCGAPTVARAATLCRRLRAAQEQLAALPAFAAGACIDGHVTSLGEAVTAAVGEAREHMPAAVDFCVCFVATPARGRVRDAVEQAMSACTQLLPPGTRVVGCCARGMFGQQGGMPVELDPSSRGSATRHAASVLLGRLPGCVVHTFSASDPTHAWKTEAACRAWLGLDGGGVGEAGALEPLSCLLLARQSSGQALYACLDGLQAAFPQMVITGGIASGAGQIFCSEGASSGTASDAGGAAAKRLATKPGYTGLMLCHRCGTAPACRVGGLTAQGMRGAPPVLTRLSIIRAFGVLQHPTPSGEPEETELLGLTGAYTPDGQDAARTLHHLAEKQLELGVWVADSPADLGSFDSAADAGRPVAVLQLYGAAEDGEALASANDDAALAALLSEADTPGRVLCAQPLQLSAEGAKSAVQRGAATLAAACPAAHPLLPTATAGLILVSCTAKGAQMYKEEGVEAAVVHTSSGGLPMCGLFADGEIGPALMKASSDVLWAGAAPPAAGAAQRGGACHARLQGFTTVITSLASAP